MSFNASETRIPLILLFTGLGYLINFAAIGYLTRQNNTELLGIIALSEGTLVLVLSLLNFGVVQVGTRNIVIREDWKTALKETQSIRTLFSGAVFLAGLCTLGFGKTVIGYTMMMAPVIALLADYALYAKGFSIFAASVSFTRIALISISILLLSILKIDSHLLFFYLTPIAIIYLSCGLVTSKKLQTFYIPTPLTLKKSIFLSSIPIGIATLALNTMREGGVLFNELFNPDSESTDFYLALKVFILFIGVKRLIVQAFVKWIGHIEVTQKIDFIVFSFSLFFLSQAISNGDEILSFLYGSSNELTAHYLMLFAVIAVISSISTSSGTRLLLSKKDNIYFRNHLITFAVFFLLNIILPKNPTSILYSLACSEIILTALHLYGLKYFPRIYFKIDHFLFLLFSISIASLIQLPNIYSVFGSSLVYGLVFLFFSKRTNLMNFQTAKIEGEC